ncbi:type I restriction modification DNA specificity protein [Alteromonadaceae bacterium 2753L.S.0a.02]|nr:type I restriction modification DNA specificity protein [Alteromonadaceae bacterium 2753L.S.0a.02]
MPLLKNLRALGDISEVRTGYTFRSKIQEVEPPRGNAHIAQIKDARSLWQNTKNTTIAAHQLPLIAWQGKPSAFVEPGTVLLPARGGYCRACCVVNSESSQLPVIASSQFLMIKPHASVLAEFLCWSLNQPHTQRALEDASQGSNIALLKATTLQQFKLAIPPLTAQQKVLNINRLWQQEQKLTQQLLNNRAAELQVVFRYLVSEQS